MIEARIRKLKERLAVRRATFDQWNSGLAMASRLNEDFDDGGEAFAVFGQRAEVAFHLEAIPEVFGLPEEGAEADRHGRGDRAAAEDDFVDGARRHIDGAGHGILRDSHGFEVFLQQDFSGRDGRVHAV